MHNRFKGYLYVFVAATLWALIGISVQIIYSNSDVTSGWLITVRMLIAGVILTAFCALKSGKDILRILKSRRDTLSFILFSAMNFLMQFSYLEAIKYSNAAIATLIQYLSPSMVLFSMAVINGKMPSKTDFICVFAALAGLILLSLHGDFSSLSISLSTLIWGLISAASLAFTSIYPVKLVSKYGSAPIQGWSMILCGAVSAFAFQPFRTSYVIKPFVWIIIILSAVLGCAVAFTMYLSGVKLIGSTHASVLSNIEPVISSVISILFLNFVCTGYDIAGMILIIGSAVTLALTGTKQAEAQK